MIKTISTESILLKLKNEKFCDKVFGENYHI
jgi:hypothetical protein